MPTLKLDRSDSLIRSSLLHTVLHAPGVDSARETAIRTFFLSHAEKNGGVERKVNGNCNENGVS